MRKLPDQKFKGIKLGPDIKTYRLFLAIFPPQNYFGFFRDVLREFDKEKRNLKYSPVDQIHLTLKFIGANVLEESKNILMDEISKYSGSFPKPLINITGVQFGFTYQDDPRVLMATLEEDKSLIDLHNYIHEIIKSLRLEDTIRWKEKNSQNFHITLARLKPSATRSTGKKVGEIAKKVRIAPPETYSPLTMEFMESKVTNTGPVYKKLLSIKL